MSDTPEHCWSYDEERFSKDFDDVAERAWDGLHPDTPETFTLYQGEVEPHSISSFFYDSDSLLENLAERAFDELGECAEDWLQTIPRDAVKELDETIKAALEAWAEKHKLQPTFYGVSNVKEVKIKPVDPAADVPDFELVM